MDINTFKKHPLIVATAVAIIILGIFLIYTSGKGNATTESIVEPKKTTTDVIVFQEWAPDNKREILATIASEKEVKIVAQAGGEIERINVNIGDSIYQNQILAQYKRSDDPLQIQFQNAQQSLLTTNISAKNSIAQSRINLQNATNQLKQVRITEDQKHQQAFEGLLTKTINTKNSFLTSLNFIDRYLGASTKFYTDDVFERSFIGNKNQIKRNDTKNKIKDLRFRFERLPNINDSLNDNGRIEYANQILSFGQELQGAFFNFDDLVRGSITSNYFTTAHQQLIQSQSEQTLSGLNNGIASLESQLEAAKTTKESIHLSVLNTENQVKNATASLELARANADGQINAAQSQYRIAQNAQIDLDLKSPIAGKVTEKNINNHDRVSSGQHLFTIINTDNSKKIVAFLSLEEWDIIRELEELTLKIDKEVITIKQNTQFGSRLDPQTQKIRVEIPIENKETLIGSFAKILLPIGNTQSTLVPLSAVSFEPDGAEVLIINEEGLSERRKVSNGDIIADSVEIIDGLDKSQKIIKYYNRVDIGVVIEERKSE